MATYIYALADPRSGEIRYIGKTARGLVHRRAQHMYEAGARKKKGYVLRWLRQLLVEGILPEITILEEVEDADNWQERERFWIAHGRAEGWPLTNIADGGEGLRAMGNRNAAGKRSPEFCHRMAEVAKETRNALEHTVSAKTRRGISEKLKEYYRNGGKAVCGKQSGASKLTVEQVREIRRRYAKGDVSMRGLAKDYPVTYSTVRNIIHHRYWRHIK